MASRGAPGVPQPFAVNDPASAQISIILISKDFNGRSGGIRTRDP